MFQNPHRCCVPSQFGVVAMLCSENQKNWSGFLALIVSRMLPEFEFSTLISAGSRNIPPSRLLK